MRPGKVFGLRTSTARRVAVWVLGVGLGGLLLTVSCVLDHREWKRSTSSADQELFLRYVDDLGEVRHVLVEHPESPRWLPWLLGYRNEKDVRQEIEMAYRGAKEGGFLPKEAGSRPDDRKPMFDTHENHPVFRRFLAVGIAQTVLLLASIPFAVMALLQLFSRPARSRRNVSIHWSPGTGLALTFWSLLAFQMAAGLAYKGISFWAPDFGSSAWAPVADNLLYLILQGGPVLACAAFLLPKSRHFVRVLGLAPKILFLPATLGLAFGLFGLDSLFELGLAELEKLGGTTDTRDFLTTTLIDANLLGLLSEFSTTVIIAPLCEEILFRGFLFGSLRGRLGPGWAALVSSLIFGGLHYYSWFGMASIALFGMFTCWVYHRTGSLWPGILLHASSNLFITFSIWYAYSEFPQ